MKQLTQKLKNGQMEVLEVPPPMLGTGMVLVKNHYSLISVGTEGSTVRAARKGLLGKAKERPEQVKRVFEVLKQRGPVQTYRAVMKKLESYSVLGYSCAGEVIEVAPDIKEFAPGDLVACGGGGYANHAEIVAVPANLCIKLPLSQKAEMEKLIPDTGSRMLDGTKAKVGIRQKSEGRRQNDGDLEEQLQAAAYTTLGAIALQGIHRTRSRLFPTLKALL